MTQTLHDVGEFDNVVPPEHTNGAGRAADDTPVDHGIDVHLRVELAREYLRVKAKPAIEGQHGDDATFRVVVDVVRGFDLMAREHEDHALAVLHIWNQTCRPPWSEHDLRTKIRSAAQPGLGHLRQGCKLQFEEDRSRRRILPNSWFNIYLALAKLGVMLSFDLFAGKPRIVMGGRGGLLDDAVARWLRLEIDKRFHFIPTKEFFTDTVENAARSRPFHPVKDYLSKLRWDSTPRIETWLIDFAGAADTKFVRAVSCIILVAAVRRVRQPGCKFDEMLIFENPRQGTNKSTAIATLCPNEAWFTDDLPLGVDSKLVIERTGGKWIIEAGELHGHSKRESDVLKSFLSRSTDGPVRLAYDRLPTEVPRQFIIIGTTNRMTNYLGDSTGNRRYWPVHVQQFDLAGLKAIREQLWAEAAYLEAQGMPIRLPEELWGDAANAQEDRRSVDPWEEFLTDNLTDHNNKAIDLESAEYVEVDRIWTALGKGGADSRNNTDAKRVAEIMERHGFMKKKRRRINDRRPMCWVRSVADEKDVPF